jgi:hypothetical protein
LTSRQEFQHDVLLLWKVVSSHAQWETTAICKGHVLLLLLLLLLLLNHSQQGANALLFLHGTCSGKIGTSGS